MSWVGKRFGEEVGKVIGAGYVYESNLLVFNKFTDIVMADVDVLDTGVTFRILGECNGIIVVCMNDGGSRLGKPYFRERGEHPLDLLCGT